MSEQKGGQDDGAWMMALIVAFIAVICWVIWYLFKFQLIQFVLWVRYAEIYAIGLVYGFDHAVDVDGYSDPIPLRVLRDMAISLDPKQTTFEQVRVLTNVTMGFLKYVFAGVIALIGLWAIFRGPTSLYRSKLDLEGLIFRQARNFKAIAPFVQFNPSNMPFRAPGSPVPAELPLFSEALGPEEWIAYNRIPMPDGALDEDAAEKAFARQLKGLWKGSLKQKDHIKILLAAFCLKANRKRGEADDMLGRVASCWSHEKGLQLSKDRALLKQAKKVLKDKNMAGDFNKIMNKHAFITTAVLAGLEKARKEGGVLAPAQFVWLRGYDRTLWYALNNLGRQSFHMEAMGAMAHFRSENLVDRPIPKPRVRDAVDALKGYMENPLLARPIPELDYSGVKKKKNKNKGVLKPA